MGSPFGGLICWLFKTHLEELIKRFIRASKNFYVEKELLEIFFPTSVLWRKNCMRHCVHFRSNCTPKRCLIFLKFKDQVLKDQWNNFNYHNVDPSVLCQKIKIPIITLYCWWDLFDLSLFGIHLIGDNIQCIFLECQECFSWCYCVCEPLVLSREETS